MPGPAAANRQETYPQSKSRLNPGQIIKVGSYKATVERFLASGGYADVYTCLTSEPIQPSNQTRFVLKRLITRNKEALAEVGWEVSVMVRLQGGVKV